jgi:hypothetical protein
MYLRLFQEIAEFEAQADALEATGVTPTNLRTYHQKRLGLGPETAVRLRGVAVECIKHLNSEGVMTRSAVALRLPARVGALNPIARVGAFLDSLAAAIGPAETAYLDSLVRRYILAVTTQPASKAFTKGSVRTGNAVLANVSSSCCANATGESPAHIWDITPGELIGARFEMYVYPIAQMANRGVWETLSGPDVYGNYDGTDGGYNFDSCSNDVYSVGPIPHSDPSFWQLDGSSVYSYPDTIAITSGVVYFYKSVLPNNSVAGCSVYVYQYLYTDDCNGGSQQDPYLGPGIAGFDFTFGDGGQTAVVTVRENGGAQGLTISSKL